MATAIGNFWDQDPTMQAVLQRAFFGLEWPKPAENQNLWFAWKGAVETYNEFQIEVRQIIRSQTYTPIGQAEKIREAAAKAIARLDDMASKAITPAVSHLASLRAAAQKSVQGTTEPITLLRQEMRSAELRGHLLGLDDTELMSLLSGAIDQADLEALRAFQGIPKFLRRSIPAVPETLWTAVDQKVNELTIPDGQREEIESLAYALGRAQDAQASARKEIQNAIGPVDPLDKIIKSLPGGKE